MLGARRAEHPAEVAGTADEYLDGDLLAGLEPVQGGQSSALDRERDVPAARSKRFDALDTAAERLHRDVRERRRIARQRSA